MNHFDNHPHAIIGTDGAVIAVAVFDGHDQDDLYASVLRDLNAKEIVCCCAHGSVPNPRDVWDGANFTPPQPVIDESVSNDELTEEPA